jgi:hypothetical protein
LRGRRSRLLGQYQYDASTRVSRSRNERGRRCSRPHVRVNLPRLMKAAIICYRRATTEMPVRQRCPSPVCTTISRFATPGRQAWRFLQKDAFRLTEAAIAKGDCAFPRTQPCRSRPWRDALSKSPWRVKGRGSAGRVITHAATLHE